MPNSKFVSRAEGKLAGAVRAFRFDFRGKVVLDVGSSTGGFTELALNQGAKKVVAVEKGSRQMKVPLRFDKRIKLFEKTDIRSVFCSTGLENPKNNLFEPSVKTDISKVFSRFGLEEEKCHTLASVRNIHFSSSNLVKNLENTFFDVCLIDVSFTSIKPILLHVRDNIGAKEYLAMLKPQFEAEEGELVKGVVKNEKIRRRIMREFEDWLKRNHFVVLNKRDNEVAGKNGNVERFYYLAVEK